MSRSTSTTIQRQLQIFLMIILSLTVLIMGGAWITYNQVQHEDEELRMLSIEGDMIGAAARPALMFNDRRMAAELLSNIRFDTDISVVKLFKPDGSTLFTYVAEGAAAALDRAVFQSQQYTRFEHGHLQMYRVIEHKGDTVGIVYLESRLDHLQEVRNGGLVTVVLVMLACLLLGLMLASRLQKKIVTPIRKLAGLMHQVSDSGDYSLRAEHLAYNRETEDLLSGFNQMADEVQAGFDMIAAQNEQLKQSERRLRNMVEVAPMPVLISSIREGRILFFNAATARMFGVDAEADITSLVTAFYRHPAERKLLLQSLERDGEVIGREIEFLRMDHTPMWASISICHIEFEGEQALISTFVDITDQKHVEKVLEEQVTARTHELKRARDTLQATLDNMLDTYYRIGPDGTLVWASASIHALLGYSLTQATGLPLSSLCGGEIDYVRAVDKLLACGGRLMNQQLSLSHAQGHSIRVSVSARLITNEHHETIGIEGVVRDITLQVQVEAQKLEMEKKMAHVQRLESLGVLAGGIAHDFNNILAGIMGNAELAEINLHDQRPVDQELKNIVVASMRAADLCKQMLAYSGQGAMIRRATNLSELVGETLQLIDASISKRVELHCELHSPMPPILADHTQMQQIIMNLVTNASEAIGEDEAGDIRVITGVIQATRADLDNPFLDEQRDAGEYAYLEVRDNGCGMDAVVQGKIFEPFFTTKFTGRGLGMSAVIGIVRSHGGVLQLDSKPGSGSCFRVLLPVNQTMQSAQEHVPKTLLAEPVAACTVLVIDDEAMVRMTAEGLLHKLGCNVMLAEDGEQGLDVYRQHAADIDMVLLDMTMPKMGGVAVLEQLRLIRADLPVFVCSGYSNEKVAGKFHQYQPNGYLHKPFSLSDLTALLSQLHDH